MGTGFHMGFNEEEVGIVPRAVEHLFNGIEARRQAAIEKGEPPPEFKVLAQFMEVRGALFVLCCQSAQLFLLDVPHPGCNIMEMSRYFVRTRTQIGLDST